MDEQQIQEIADRIATALEGLAPGEPGWWEPWAAFGGYAALIAAVVAFWVGSRSLKQQRRALRSQIRSDEKSLKQKRTADGTSEWWRRTQWALEATYSDSTAAQTYGRQILDSLATSDLASSEDKLLLDTVWSSGPTAMTPDGILGLLEQAQELKDDYEESDEPESPQSIWFSHVEDFTDLVENRDVKEETDGDKI